MLQRTACCRRFLNKLKTKFHDAQLRAEAAADAADAAELQRCRDGVDAVGSPLDRYLKMATANSSSTKRRGGGDGVAAVQSTTAPRSALFVPCSNAKALAKMSTLVNVDLFVLDLEDSVAPSRKQDARNALTKFVDAGGLRGMRAIVRINSLRTDPANGMLDLECVSGIADAIEGLGIPKVALGDHAQLHEYLHPAHCLWAFFETPRSILDADRICGEGVYQYGVMGLNDLSNEMGYPLNLKGPRVQHYHSMSAVVTACRAHGVTPLDGVFNDPTDTIGLKEELVECRRFGFDGKTLIHPSQVVHCNEAFTPTELEVDWAERVVRAVTEAGEGVAVVDGKMVEALHARQAARMLARHALSKKASSMEAASA